MTKKNFIAMAIEVRYMLRDGQISDSGIERLARFCYAQNSAFNKDRWLGFIYGRCGSNGGEIKKKAVANA